MNNFKKMVQNFKVVYAVQPKDWTGAAAVGDYVSLKGYGHCTIVIQTGSMAGTAAAVTVNQAKTVAAGSVKALTFSEMWTGCVSGTDDILARTTVTANTFTLAVDNSLYIIEVNAEDLDAANDFDCLSLAIATPGTSTDIYGGLYILGQGRYLGEPPLTAITD